VYVTDPQSDSGCSKHPRVLKFDSNGNFITKFGSYGTEPDQFIDPEHLAIDNEDDVYVSDRSNNKILVFSPISNSQNG
jgi:6-bladed beta-propeller